MNPHNCHSTTCCNGPHILFLHSVLASKDVLLQYIGVGAFVGETLQEVSASGAMLTVVWISPDSRFAGRWFRTMLTIIFILPKAALAFWLIVVGSQFVLTSAADVDLIMNCVALTFVNSMDDVMYNNLYHLYAEQHNKLGWSVYFKVKTVEAGQKYLYSPP